MGLSQVSVAAVVTMAEKERWDVSSFSRAGMAHAWIDVDENRVRSKCGIVEKKQNLQGLKHEICRCKRCKNKTEAQNG